jgi:hypothetical protein
LARPYAEICSKLNIFFSARENEFKPIPNVQNDLLILGYIPILINFSGAFFEIDQFSDNEEIKFNASKLREITDRTIIRSLSPYIVLFLKWDLERRTWTGDSDENKISYLRKQVNELDNELQGKEQLVKKYVALLIDFAAAKFDEYASKINFDQFENRKFDKHKFFETRNKFMDIANNNKIDEVVDEDMELLLQRNTDL